MSLPAESPEEAASLDDLLQELRILLNGVEVLTGFLIVLPFNQGFDRIQGASRWVYVATFLCALAALVCFAAPAAQHRLMRPLPDRLKFKRLGTKLAITGLVPFSFCLVLSTYLVTQQVVGGWGSTIVTVAVTVVIGICWWIVPLTKRKGAG